MFLLYYHYIMLLKIVQLTYHKCLNCIIQSLVSTSCKCIGKVFLICILLLLNRSAFISYVVVEYSCQGMCVWYSRCTWLKKGRNSDITHMLMQDIHLQHNLFGSSSRGNMLRYPHHSFSIFVLCQYYMAEFQYIWWYVDLYNFM
jgi:hypothetical protein